MAGMPRDSTATRRGHLSLMRRPGVQGSGPTGTLPHGSTVAVLLTGTGGLPICEPCPAVSARPCTTAVARQRSSATLRGLRAERGCARGRSQTRRLRSKADKEPLGRSQTGQAEQEITQAGTSSPGSPTEAAPSATANRRLSTPGTRRSWPPCARPRRSCAAAPAPPTRHSPADPQRRLPASAGPDRGCIRSPLRATRHPHRPPHRRRRHRRRDKPHRPTGGPAAPLPEPIAALTRA